MENLQSGNFEAKNFATTEAKEESDCKQIINCQPMKFSEYDNLKQIVFGMSKIKEYANCIEDIINNAPSLGPIIAQESLDKINQESFRLESQMKNLLGIIQKELDDTTKWRCFLHFLYERLSQWEVHRNQAKFDLSAWKEELKLWQISGENARHGRNLKPYLRKIYPNHSTGFELIENLSLDTIKIGNLKDVLDITANNKPPVSVCESNTLRVKGHYVALSDVQCPEHVENLEIVALHRFYVDMDWKSGSSNLKAIVIVAPTWEIVSNNFSNRTINLDGSDGEEHNELQAKAGRSSGESGEDGKCGLPGGPAGSFLGFAGTIINSEKLTIRANGGAGGIGQHGGDGYSGKDTEIFEAGVGGAGGSGGIGGCKGSVALYVSDGNCEISVSNLNGKIGERGQKGAGDNEEESENVSKNYDEDELEIQVDAQNLQDACSILNDYKAYVMETLANSEIKQALSKRFIEYINGNEYSKKYCSTRDFASEFIGLESQFYKLRKDINFLEFYESLLKRFSAYLACPKPQETTPEYQAVQSFLYTAILTKISALKHGNFKNNLITNMDAFIQTALDCVDDYKNDVKSTALNNFNHTYKATIDSKIEEATCLINEHITPEILKIHDETRENFEKLCDELWQLKNNAESKKEELSEKRKKLKKVLKLSLLFGVLKVVSKAANFFGPIGEATGSVLEGITTVTEHIALKKSMSGIPTELEKHLSKAASKSMEYLREEKLRTLKEKLDNLQTGNLAKDSEAVQSDIKKEIDTLKGESKRDKESSEPIKQITSMAEIIAGVYKKYKDDKGKVKAIGEEIDEACKELQSLVNFESDIHDVMVPMAEKIHRDTTDMMNSLENSSHATLDYSKWEIQRAIRDMKFKMMQYTKGYEIEENLSHCIGKLDEAMDILIDIYDRIQTYKDQRNLADCVGYVAGLEIESIISNAKLKEAVNCLQLAIKSNLILCLFERVLDGYKHLIFPFANHKLENFSLSEKVSFDNIDILVEKATESMQSIQAHLNQSKMTIMETDQFINNCNFYRGGSLGSFYTWPYGNYSNQIRKLLSGEQITLRADPATGSSKNAVKFNKIDLVIRAENATFQKQLDEDLKNFQIELRHMGQSDYKYKDQIYRLLSEPQTISFSYLKINDEPATKNEVYVKLENTKCVLSPYTKWKIQLKSCAEKANFEKFKNIAVSLELSGKGQYLEPDVPLNFEDFKNHYAFC